MLDERKIMQEQLNIFIKDLETIESYYKDGYSILWDILKCNLTVTYNNNKYVVSLVIKDNQCYWHLVPYNHSFFETAIEDGICNFNYVLFAIKENEMLYNKKGN